MGHRSKPYTKLVEELNAAHKEIMKARSLSRGKREVIGTRDIMHCFTLASRPDTPFDPNNEVDVISANNLLAAYVRKGYLRFVPKSKGGMGYEVNAEYLTGENAITTTIVDAAKNLVSKLKPHHNTALSFLCDICNVSPSMSVSGLLDLLRKPEGDNYRALFELKSLDVGKPVAERIKPSDLDNIHVKNIQFDGDNWCTVQSITLHQAYKIGSALDTTSKTSAIISTLSEPGVDRPGVDETRSTTLRSETDKVIEKAEADRLSKTGAPF